jgi:hypothetical protein
MSPRPGSLRPRECRLTRQVHLTLFSFAATTARPRVCHMQSVHQVVEEGVQTEHTGLVHDAWPFTYRDDVVPVGIHGTRTIFWCDASAPNKGGT